MARALHAETTTQPRGPGNAKIRRKTKSHSRKHAASMASKSQKNLVDDFDDEGEEDEDDEEENENEQFTGKSNTANSKSNFSFLK